jgi:hypothetical protein
VCVCVCVWGGGGKFWKLNFNSKNKISSGDSNPRLARFLGSRQDHDPDPVIRSWFFSRSHFYLILTLMFNFLSSLFRWFLLTLHTLVLAHRTHFLSFTHPLSFSIFIFILSLYPVHTDTVSSYLKTSSRAPGSLESPTCHTNKCSYLHPDATYVFCLNLLLFHILIFILLHFIFRLFAIHLCTHTNIHKQKIPALPSPPSCPIQ